MDNRTLTKFSASRRRLPSAKEFDAQSALDRCHANRNLRLSAAPLRPHRSTFCHVCGREVKKDSPESAADEILEALKSGTRFYVLFSPTTFCQSGGEKTKSDGGFNEPARTRFFETFARRRNA
jgi:hypothetical protein